MVRKGRKKRKGSRKQLQGLMSAPPLRGLNRPTISQTNSIAHVELSGAPRKALYGGGTD
jgi:hypothetical protein